MVGRYSEIARRSRCWEMACEGHGQVVGLSGDAGIGKSRIAQAIVEQLGDSVGELLRFQCAPYHVNSAFHPIVERLTQAAGLLRSDPPEKNYERIRAIAEAHYLETETDAPIYAALVDVDAGEADVRRTLEPQALKHRIIETLTRSVVQRAAHCPLLLIVEDAHWIDPSSFETFERIADLCADIPVMLLMTHRPEWSCDWASEHPYVSALKLGRLSGDHVSQLIGNMLHRPVEAGLIEDLVDRTDGVPLFVEELARALMEKSDGALGDAIPHSLQGVLLERLERVSRSSRTLALIASVIGRDFDGDILAAVSGLDQQELDAALQELRRANIIYESSRDAGGFAFRHALIQDAAYQAILRSKKRSLHGLVARSLEKLRASEVAREPELLARHYTEAGEATLALESWNSAARRALERSATYEAVSHAAEALAVSEEMAGQGEVLPDVAKARILLSEAHTQAGNLPQALKSAWQAADEARKLDDPDIFASAAMAYMDCVMLSADSPAPAIALCKEAFEDERTKDTMLRCRLLSHLARGHMMNGDFEASTQYGRRAEKMARDLGDDKGLFNQMMSRFLAPVVARDAEEVANWRERAHMLLDLAERSDDADRGRAGAIAAYVSIEMGDRDLMELAMQRLKDVGAVRQHMHMNWVWLHGQAMVAILDGDYDGAEKIARDALKLGMRTHGSHVEGLYGVQMFSIRREQGRLAEVAPVFKRLLDEETGDKSWKPGFALIAAELGHLEPAQRMMNEMAVDGFDLPLDAKYSATLGYLADTAIMIGDEAMAGTLYDRLLPYSGMTITIGVSTVCHGSADRILGALAALRADWAAMERHFETALTVDAAIRSAPCVAQTKADFALGLMRRGNLKDVERTNQLLCEAMETAKNYGMVRLQKAVTGASN
ncbi:MAG: AAA family ATPase [Arenibacterium sp.]